MDELLQELRQAVGAAHVATGDAAEESTHDATFLTHDLRCAVHPASTEEVAAVVRACAARQVPVVARGSGTSLVGGSVPLAGGVVLGLDRLDRIEIDAPNTVAVAGAGAITGLIDESAGRAGLMYPPDPASIDMCSIGGNVACNSGGMRCIKYGLTADYVMGLTVVLADGRVLRLGGRLRKRSSGYRLIQLFVGSEGTLGVVTEVILKLLPKPRHQATAMVGFRSLADAGAAVSRVLAAGHFPACLEIMDREAMELLRDRLPQGFEPDLAAVLLIEQDGNEPEQVQLSLLEMVELLDGVDNRIAQSSQERERLWDARRSFGKVLMAKPHNNFTEDVAVPISRIPEMAARIEGLSRRTGVRIVTIGHIGDGNLHPTVVFEEEQREVVSGIAAQIFRDAIDLGGTISAEHGLGALKRDYAAREHGPEAIALMRSLKDLMDP
ncbi:MAG: FAD-binding oxidoreductase, partial [Candidatus Dormibacteraceae bacterium]